MNWIIAKRNIISDALFWIALIFVGFGAADFFSLEGILLTVGCIFLGLSVLFQGLPRVKLFYLLVCAVFCLCYAGFSIIWFGFKVSDILHFLVWPFAFYILGCCNSENKSRHLMILITIIIAYTLRTFYLVINSIIYQGFYFNNHLTITSVSDGKMLYISRNGLSLFSIPMFAIFLYSFGMKKSKKRMAIKLISSVLAILSVVFAMVVGNRAFVVVTVVSIAMLIALYIGKTKNKTKKYVILAISLTALLLLFLMYFGFLPIPDFLMKIPVIKRILSGGSNQERFKLYVSFFSKAWKYPIGGLYNEMGKYVHNFILDIYNFAGIVPMVAFLIFLFVLIKKFAGTPMLNNESNYHRSNLYSAFCFIVPLCLLGFFEPILQTDGFVTSIFFYFFGLVLGTKSKICSKADIKRSVLKI